MMNNRSSRDLGAVAAATVAVFVTGQRVGSGILVDERRLLTAGHVVRRVNVSAGVVAPSIEVVFPVALGADGARVPVRQVPLGTNPAVGDVGVLELIIQGEPPDWLPTPVSLSPRRSRPARVSVFGFPREEKVLRGVWREFDVAGPTADATVQLDWAGDVGTLRGHSGGPVVNAVTGELVGVLVQGSKTGRFDRFLPIVAISRFYPDLPLPWLMVGSDVRSHFVRRSRGHRGHSRGADLFRGRQAALDTVRHWLTSSQSQGRPLVVTGQPGAGKSAVVARAALGLEADRIGPGLLFHARGAVHDELLRAVVELAGVEEAKTCEALLDALDSAPRGGRLMIVVDALDEAASNSDRRQMAETLVELATVPLFRIVVAARRLAVDDRDRYRFGGLLSALGISSSDSTALVDLDTDQYFESVGLRQFVVAVLTQHQAKYPSPVGAAWTVYRADPVLCNRLADVIAMRADRNYLVAAMAAVRLSTTEQPVDPAVVGFDPASIPTGVGGALTKLLDQLPESQQSRIRTLLTALAYARGTGIDDGTWQAFSQALGYPVTTAHLDQIRSSTGADYLVQTVVDDDGPLTRLFHQALADELLVRRHQSSDERALLSALRPAPGTTWAAASSYALTYAADHASNAQQLLSLVNDADYLAYADLARLPSLLSLDADVTADPAAVVVRQVAIRANPLPPGRRIRLLALTAAHFGLTDLRRRLADACDQPFIPEWAHSLGIPHAEIGDHANMVRAVAIGRIGDRDIIVSGEDDFTVRIWDASTGRPHLRPLTGHNGPVGAVVIGRIGDRHVIVSGGEDFTVRIWDAIAGRPLLYPLTGHTDEVYTVAIGRIGDRDVIVSGGGDGTVRIWDATTGRPQGKPLTGHTRVVRVVAIGRIGERDVIVSASFDGTLRMWDAVTGRPVLKPLTGHTDAVFAMALGHVGDRDVIVSGGADGTVRIWDATTGRPRGKPLTAHADGVDAVAFGRIGDRDVIVSGGGDHAVRIWDAATGRPHLKALTGHTSPVDAVAIGRIGDRDVIVSGGGDRTLRVWDLLGSIPIGEPLTGHTDRVAAVGTRRIREHDVIVSVGGDGTVRMWDAANGRPQAKPLVPLPGHGGLLRAVAVGRVGDRDVIVSGDWDRTVRVWDVTSGRPRPMQLTGHTNLVEAVAVGRIGDRDVIVSGGWDATVRVWDATTGRPHGKMSP